MCATATKMAIFFVMLMKGKLSLCRTERNVRRCGLAFTWYIEAVRSTGNVNDWLGIGARNELGKGLLSDLRSLCLYKINSRKWNDLNLSILSINKSEFWQLQVVYALQVMNTHETAECFSCFVTTFIDARPSFLEICLEQPPRAVAVECCLYSSKSNSVYSLDLNGIK